MIRPLIWAALLSAFIVLTASSALRLSADGLSCSPWPACYGQPATAEAAHVAPTTQALRAVHRVAATVFGLLAVALLILGWRRFARGQRLAAVWLLAVTAALAWLGRHTPSPLPAVSLANVLGGLALIALLAWLLAYRSDHQSRIWPVGLLGFALALQAAGGVLISARLAATACSASCTHAWPPGIAALWNLGRPGSAIDLLGQPEAGRPLVALHALTGIGIVLAAPLLDAAYGDGRHARALAFVAGVTSAAGLSLYAFGSPLWVAVLHTALAGGLIATLAVSAAASRSMLREGLQ
jgi:cytochrome c oxidase assembly protein subunit 15